MSAYPKAPLISIRFARGAGLRPFLLGPFRLANAATMWLGPLCITWRRPWLKDVATQLYGERP